MKQPNSPCYKCGDRSATCHAECEKYKNWLAEHNADVKRNLLRAQYAQYEQERYMRLTRRKKKRFEGGHQ